MEKIFSYTELYNFTYNIFKAIGCNDVDAITATKALLAADIRE
jgi:LDH2 family malate/lactate/ureidoglycolate dehydrogenase